MEGAYNGPFLYIGVYTVPLPVGLDTVTLTGTYQDVLGNPLSGFIRFEGPTWLVDTTNDIVFTSNEVVQLVNGSFSVELAATDATGVIPSPFTYQVIEVIEGMRPHRYRISLPKSNPTADISDLINIADFL